jgi:general secretion pathway protein M
MTGAGPVRSRGFVWWNRRTARERTLIGLLGFTLAIYLLATGVLRPLLEAHASAVASITGSEVALARLANTPIETEQRPIQMADEPIATILTSTATVFGLTIRRIEVTGEGAELAIEDAEFEDVIRWIETLERDYGLRLSTLEMDRRPEPGLVSARLGVLR